MASKFGKPLVTEAGEQKTSSPVYIYIYINGNKPYHVAM